MVARLVPLALAALALAVSGCAPVDEGSSLAVPHCNGSPTDPLAKEEVIDVFRQHGISLAPDLDSVLCGGDTPVALANDARADVEGHAFCHLRTRPIYGDDLDIKTLHGVEHADRDVVLANLECALFSVHGRVEQFGQALDELRARLETRAACDQRSTTPLVKDEAITALARHGFEVTSVPATAMCAAPDVEVGLLNRLARWQQQAHVAGIPEGELLCDLRERPHASAGRAIRTVPSTFDVSLSLANFECVLLSSDKGSQKRRLTKAFEDLQRGLAE